MPIYALLRYLRAMLHMRLPMMLIYATAPAHTYAMFICLLMKEARRLFLRRCRHYAFRHTPLLRLLFSHYYALIIDASPLRCCRFHIDFRYFHYVIILLFAAMIRHA